MSEGVASPEVPMTIKNTELQIPTKVQKSDSRETNPHVDQRDGFSRALEMMEQNGTDEQTKRVYGNILDVIKLSQSKINKGPEDFTRILDNNNILFNALKGWANPHFEIPGMPLVSAVNPQNPSFELSPNYHNGGDWVGRVCVEDPTLKTLYGNIAMRKPNGEFNEAGYISIDPGDERNPGNIYDKNPFTGEKQPLKEIFRQRIDDAFIICKTIELIYRINPASRIGLSVPPEVLSFLVTREGKKLPKSKIYPKNLYLSILEGEISLRTSVRKQIEESRAQMKSSGNGW